MKRTSVYGYYLVGVFAIAITKTSFAQLSLAADDAPVDPLWKHPATVSYVKNGDGTSNTKIDAVIRYKWLLTATGDTKTASQSSYSLAGYTHHDNNGAKPRDDRGISAGFSQTFIPEFDNSAGPRSVTLNAKLSVGNTLEEFKSPAGIPLREDRTKDRQLVQVTGYYQTPLSGTPPDSSAALPTLFSGQRQVLYFLGNLGAYSDHSSGGNGDGTGRLSGGVASIDANWAPFGIDPAGLRLAGLGFVPTARLAAQVQHDAHSSGSRKKDTYRLYTVGISLAFTKLDAGTLVPTLTLQRSIGADILAGRPDTAKTEIAFGLTF
ncbi:MAG: hypothetical protein ABIP34_08345 [Rhodoferax sp.]|uniref:hypothetical protein n=1 Tax=Rhodoferax sp. TaxID=50421 RepID=UPI00326465FC